MKDFNYGPFRIESSIFQHEDKKFNRWHLSYNQKRLATVSVHGFAKKSEIIQALSDSIKDFINENKQTQEYQYGVYDDAYALYLVESSSTGFEAGDIDEFFCFVPIEGLVSCLIDDRYKTWAVTRKVNWGSGGSSINRAVPMTKDEFERLKTANKAIEKARIAAAIANANTDAVAPLAWVLDLLPEEVTTEDPDVWRAPTSWEIRHLVGVGSFSGLSGAQAARLIGMSPQGFRKYTASDNSKNRQNMSYAAWHLLLKKIGAKN